MEPSCSFNKKNKNSTIFFTLLNKQINMPKQTLKARKSIQKKHIQKKHKFGKTRPGESPLQALIRALDGGFTFKGRNSSIVKKKLMALDELVGQQPAKETVANLLFFVSSTLTQKNVFKNISITGAPGSGKTEFSSRAAELLQYIFYNVDKPVTILGRSDLVGRVLGETAQKTKTVLMKNRKRVIFLDEIYALGAGTTGGESKDSFSVEAINTLVAHLSEYINECSVIVAGYHGEVEAFFFDSNPGLARRFPWKVELGRYSVEELLRIFRQKMQKIKFDENEVKEFLRTAPDGAASVMQLREKILLRHARDICLDKQDPKEIKASTLREAINDCKPADKPNPCAHMYM